MIMEILFKGREYDILRTTLNNGVEGTYIISVDNKIITE